MVCKLWRTVDGGDYMLYVPYEYKQVIQGIERYRNWKVAATYQKDGKITALQYKLPHNEATKARRIVKRINFA